MIPLATTGRAPEMFQLPVGGDQIQTPNEIHNEIHNGTPPLILSSKNKSMKAR